MARGGRAPTSRYIPRLLLTRVRRRWDVGGEKTVDGPCTTPGLAHAGGCAVPLVTNPRPNACVCISQRAGYMLWRDTIQA